jgi:hypothetical protein
LRIEHDARFERPQVVVGQLQPLPASLKWLKLDEAKPVFRPKRRAGIDYSPAFPCVSLFRQSAITSFIELPAGQRLTIYTTQSDSVKTDPTDPIWAGPRSVPEPRVL